MSSHPGNENIEGAFEQTTWALELNGEIITSKAAKKYWSEKNYFDEQPLSLFDILYQRSIYIHT